MQNKPRYKPVREKKRFILHLFGVSIVVVYKSPGPLSSVYFWHKYDSICISCAKRCGNLDKNILVQVHYGVNKSGHQTYLGQRHESERGVVLYEPYSGIQLHLQRDWVELEENRSSWRTMFSKSPCSVTENYFQKGFSFWLLHLLLEFGEHPYVHKNKFPLILDAH